MYSGKKKYWQWKEAGLCRRCGADPISGETRCERCAKKHREYQDRVLEKSRAKGKCRYCLTEGRLPGKAACKNCLEKNNARSLCGHAKHRSLCLESYGGKCICCGCNNPKYLQLDHKNGGGDKHRKELTGGGRGGAIYGWAVRNDFPNILQLMCANCHQAKTHYGGCSSDDHPLHKE